MTVKLLCGSGSKLSRWMDKRLSPSRRSATVASLYRHSVNVMELCVVFGPFFPYIAVSSVLSLCMLRWTALSWIRSSVGDSWSYESFAVGGVPGFSWELSVMWLGVMSVFMFSGGALYPGCGWWVGVVCGCVLWCLCAVTRVVKMGSDKAADRGTVHEHSFYEMIQ